MGEARVARKVEMSGDLGGDMHQGEIARKLRERMKWTQADIQREFERRGRTMTRSNVGWMEKREWLDGEVIVQLAAIFDVPILTFFPSEAQPVRETREEAIHRAFQYVRQDKEVRVGAAQLDSWPTEAKLAVVRIYEHYTGKRLVPYDM